MNRSDILEAALKLEEDGKSFYLETAAKAGNELAKKTFESFAKDEALHIEWIKKAAEENTTEANDSQVKEIYPLTQVQILVKGYA